MLNAVRKLKLCNMRQQIGKQFITR